MLVLILYSVIVLIITGVVVITTHNLGLLSLLSLLFVGIPIYQQVKDQAMFKKWDSSYNEASITKEERDMYKFESAFLAPDVNLDASCTHIYRFLGYEINILPITVHHGEIKQRVRVFYCEKCLGQKYIISSEPYFQPAAYGQTAAQIAQEFN